MKARPLTPESYLPDDELLQHLVERHGSVTCRVIAEHLWPIPWRPLRQGCDSLSVRVRPLRCPLGSPDLVTTTAARWVEASLVRLAAAGVVRLLRADQDDLVFGPAGRAQRRPLPALDPPPRPAVVL